MTRDFRYFAFRPQLRFSLRTFLVALTLLCGLLGWLGYQLNWISQRRELIRNRLVAAYPGDSTFRPKIARVSAPGLLWILGEKGYAVIDCFELVSDADQQRAARLFPEARCILYPSQFVEPESQKRWIDRFEWGPSR